MKGRDFYNIMVTIMSMQTFSCTF